MGPVLATNSYLIEGKFMYPESLISGYRVTTNEMVSGWEFKYNNKNVSVDISTLKRDAELINSISFYLSKFTVVLSS
jgi:hypothetical protein